VFVRADPTTGVQSIQQVTVPTDETGKSGVAAGEMNLSTETHDAPQFQATASRESKKDEIGLMNPDGSGVALLKLYGTDPSLSPDGTKVAYCSTKETQYFQVFVANVDGSSAKRVTNFDHGDACGPVWSHDGKKIAFYAYALPNPSRNPGVWVMNPDGSSQMKLTDHGLDPAWSPDDRQIGFASNREGGVFQVYSMNADGSNLKRLTKGNVEASNPAWAPDGQAIAYSAATEGDRRALFLMAKDGSDPRRLAFSKHQDFCFPAWSLDGKYIAFTSLNRVGPQGIITGEERPRCEQWTGEYQIFTFDSDGKTRRLTDAKLSAMRASYGKAAGQ
jgi:dipeptidyl aminopeptidase/acylaminoacyl peptidase